MKEEARQAIVVYRLKNARKTLAEIPVLMENEFCGIRQ